MQKEDVITSYSIHYTKLYEEFRSAGERVDSRGELLHGGGDEGGDDEGAQEGQHQEHRCREGDRVPDVPLPCQDAVPGDGERYGSDALSREEDRGGSYNFV